MTSIDRLIAGFESGDLLRPAPGVPNTVDLARVLARLAGSESVADTAGTRAVAGLIGHAEHLVFALVDGLGTAQLEFLGPESFLNRRVAMEMRSVFPSTTATALTSLATGEWPSRHAVTSWWTHIPEIAGPATILPFVTRFGGRPLTDEGVAPEAAFPIPSLWQSFTRDSVSVLPHNLTGGVYSTYFAGGSGQTGYRGIADAVDVVLQRVRSSSDPTYTYLYMPHVDSAAHAYGARHGNTLSALQSVSQELERLSQGLEGRGRLVVSADHGHLDRDPRGPLLIQAGDDLASLLKFPPAGDARVMYFHVDNGRLNEFEAGFAQRAGDRVALLRTAQVEELQLLGPGALSEATRRRIGDCTAVSLGATVMGYVDGEAHEDGLAAMISHHSGLTPDEVRIPLIIA